MSFFSRLVLQSLLLLSFVVGLTSAAAASPADDEKAQTIVHMLDYVGVDYPEFVRDGKVLNAEEYAEQREFAEQAMTLLEQLPTVPEQPALARKAKELLTRIEAKAAGAEVSALASALRTGVIQAWKLSVAPRQPPDLLQGARLFAQNCAACHCAEGRGNGPLAKAMQPLPSDFHDKARMRT